MGACCGCFAVKAHANRKANGVDPVVTQAGAEKAREEEPLSPGGSQSLPYISSFAAARPTRTKGASTKIGAKLRRAWSSVAGGPEIIMPERVPEEPIAINELDLAMIHFPGVTAHNFYHGRLNVGRVKDAFSRVLTNNPTLAGRLRCKERSASGDPVQVEVHFDAELGVPFHVKEMDPVLEFELQGFKSDKSVAANPLEWEAMVEKLGILNAGPGVTQIDQPSKPLCTVTYIAGKSTSVLTMSVSHLVGDGSTYFQLLGAWDQEVSAPGSSLPMTGRDTVLAVDREFKSKYTEWERNSLAEFYPDKYIESYLCRNLLDYHMVSTSLNDDVLKKIKSEQKAKIGDGVVFSTQDSLIAWLGKAVMAKWFSFTVDLRGRAVALPTNAMGNAFQTWYGVPQLGPAEFSALDVRRAIDSKGTNIRPAMEHALKTGIDDSIDVNSWLKLQYLPAFGGTLWKQVRALGRGSLPFLFRMNYHVIYQIEKGQYIMFNFGLRADQAEQLAAKWKALGATSAVTSGSELVEALGDSHPSLLDDLGRALTDVFPSLPGGLTEAELAQFRVEYQTWRASDKSPSATRTPSEHNSTHGSTGLTEHGARSAFAKGGTATVTF